ncbi:hypothetical protein FRC07_009757, partial [Ceratobasidium sp. 392]
MSDPLAKLPGGEKPNRLLKDGETVEIASNRGSSKYTIKRTTDHYYCSCPAWRNQSRVKSEVRTCKHLKELLGEAYELARIALTTTKPPNKATTSKSHSKSESSNNSRPHSRNTRSRKRKASDEDEDANKDEDEADKPASTASKDDKDDKDDKPAQPDSKIPDGDDLAEIDGIKPNAYLKDGEEQEVKSLTSSAVYKVKRTWDHYYCTCPAWRNQGGAPTNARTCKHLKALLGDDYEAARIKQKNPHGAAASSTNDKGTRASKRQKKDSGDAGASGSGSGSGSSGV